MTNAIELLHPAVAESLKKYGIEQEVMACDPDMADTAAFCEHYKISPTQTANCIIAVGKSEPLTYACCVVLATCKLDVNKKLSQLLGIKRCSFAGGEQTLDLTGMMIGGVTPFGVPEMPIYIDAAVMNNEKIVLGGGNRSSKLLLNPAELHKLPNVQIVEALGIPR
jgi:prolyl-tRNA editing enzyme YbaK/EbsC (Cys-tRNA(Pro) deacylase)